MTWCIWEERFLFPAPSGTTPLRAGYSGFIVTLLGTGKVLIAGGIAGVYPHQHVTAAADPSTGTSDPQRHYSLLRHQTNMKETAMNKVETQIKKGAKNIRDTLRPLL